MQSGTETLAQTVAYFQADNSVALNLSPVCSPYYCSCILNCRRRVCPRPVCVPLVSRDPYLPVDDYLV